MVLRLPHRRILRRPEASRSSLTSVGSAGTGTGRSGAFRLASAASQIGERARRSAAPFDCVAAVTSGMTSEWLLRNTRTTQCNWHECPVLNGGFNRSAQHLLIYEVRRCAGDVADGLRQRRKPSCGAMEERAKCCAISRALERKNKTGVERIVVLHGGIGPAPRRRAPAALRSRNAKRFPVAFRWAGRCGRSPRASDGRHRQQLQIRRNGGSQAYRANRA